MKRDSILTFCFLLLVLAGLFFPIFTKNQFPFPGNYMLVWYEPWKSIFSPQGVPSISHKAVADDVFRQLYPYKILIADVMRRFELPFWNPYNGAGMPFLATMHVGFLTPANVFFLLFSNFLGWTLFIVTQPFLIFFFTYLFCRKIAFSISASIFSSVTFTLSGFSITRLIFGEYLYVVAGLPLLLYLIECFLQGKSRHTILFIPLTICFIIFSGQPQIIFYVLSFSVAYFLFRHFLSIHPNIKSTRKNLPMFLFLYCIGIGLAGIQLLPTFELFTQAGLDIESSKFIFNRFLLPPYHLVSILIPNYFGNQGTYNYWGFGDYIETIAAVGLIPCFFAFISITVNYQKLDSRKKFFFFTILFSILATLDWFVTRIFYSFPLPLLSTGAPTRIFLLTTFSIAMLAGYGLDLWTKIHNIHKHLLKAIFIFIFGMLAVAAVTYFNYLTHVSCNNEFVQNCRSVAARNTTIELFVFGAAFAVFLSRITLQKKKVFQFAPYIIILITLIVGIYNAHKFLPFSKKESFYLQLPVLQALQEKTTDARVFSLGSNTITTNLATQFRYFDPNYYDPLYNKRYGELIAYANMGKINSPLKRSDVEITKELKISKYDFERRDRLFSILNVGYLLVGTQDLKNISFKQNVWKDSQWSIIRNTNALPRAYLVDSYLVEKSDEEILKTLFSKEFNPTTSVILEKAPENYRKSLIPLSGSAKTIRYEENKVIFETNSNKETIFVLTDNYFPGWKAFIDENKAKIYRGNYTFRAVVVPAGKHIVRFSYEPMSFLIGMYVSLLSFIALCLLFFFWPKISRNKHH